MDLTRRELGRMALAAAPAMKLFAKVDSTFGGVSIGVITYSFRGINNLDEIINTMVKIGVGECELMSNHAESGAGAPAAGGFPGGGLPGAGAPGRGPGQAPPRGAAPGGPPNAGGTPGAPARQPGRFQMTPEMQAAMKEQQAKLAEWRKTVSMDKFKEVRAKFDKAGINLGLLCYNMRDSMSDDDIEYGFQMARALGVKGITTSTTVSMSKRIAALADKHKMLVGYHGHDQTQDPNEFATLESYATAFTYSKFNGINLDVGHFTASNYDAVAFIRQHHARITNLHLKDRKKDHGPNTPWGEGDTPLKDVLLLLKKEKYGFPANIELEYRVPEGSDAATEVAKCLKYCRDILS